MTEIRKQARIQVDVDGADRAIGTLRSVNQEVAKILQQIEQQIQRTKTELENILKVRPSGATAAAGAPAAGGGNAAGGNTLRDTVALSKALGVSYTEAQALADSLGRSAREARELVNLLRSLGTTGLPLAEQARVLNEQLGVTQQQFQTLSRFAIAPVKPDTVADVARLAQTLGVSYREAERLTTELGLTSKQTTAALASMKKLAALDVPLDEQFKLLNKELNITRQQFDKISQQQQPKKGFLGGISGFLGGSTGSQLTAIASTLSIFGTALRAATATAGPAFDLLIGQNERLNQQLLRSQTSLAASTRQFNSFGDEITSIPEKVRATSGALRQALIQVQRDTLELSGVTTAQVNESFNIVLENSRFLVGQSRETADTIDNARRLTKGLVAALGTIGLPIQQVRQEFRALITGDLNNANAQLAKTLNISREQFNQAKAQGRLVDFLNEKFQVYIAGNREASRSIEAITSNLQSLFEDTARILGEPIIKPLTDQLFELQEAILSNQAAIEKEATGVGKQLGQLFSEAATTIGVIFRLLQPTLEKVFETLLKGGKVALDGITAILQGFNAVGNAVADFRVKLEQTFPLLEKINSLSIGDALAQAQRGFGILGGGLRQTSEALETYAPLIDQVANKSLELATELSKLNKKPVEELTEAEQKRLKVLKILATSQSEAIAQYRADLEELKTFDDAQEADRVAKLAALKQAQEQLSKQGVDANGVTLAAQELEKFGATADVLKERAKSAFDQIREGAGGSTEEFKKAIDNALKLQKTLIEIGAIDLKQGVAELVKLLENPAVDPEKRLEIQKQANELIAKGADGDKEKLNLEKQRIETKRELGDLSSGEAQIALNEVEINQQKISLEIARQQLEIAQKAGNTREAERLTTEIERLNEKVSQLGATSEKLKLQEKLKEAQQAAEEAQDTLEITAKQRENALKASTKIQNDTQAAANADLIKLELETAQQQIAIQQAKQAELEALVGSATGEEKRKLEKELRQGEKSLLNLQGRLTELNAKLSQSQADVLRERQEQARQELTIEQNKQELLLEQRKRAGGLTEAAARAESSKLAQQRLQLEVEQAKALEAELNKITPASRDQKIQLEKQKREAAAATFQKQKELLKAQTEGEKAAYAAQLEEFERKQKRITQQLDLQGAREELALRQQFKAGLKNERDLAVARARLSSSRLQQELQQAKQREEALAKLAVPADADARFEQETKLADARLETLKKQSALLEAQQAEEKAAREQQIFALEGILAKQKLFGDRVQADLRNELALRNLVTESLQRQAALSDSQTRLDQARLNLAQQESRIRVQTLQTTAGLLSQTQQAGASEKRLLESRLRASGVQASRATAELDLRKQILAELQQQASLEQEALAAKQAAEVRSAQLANEQARVAAENRVAEAKQARLNLEIRQQELLVEVEKAKLSADAEVRERALAAAQQAVKLNRQSLELQDKQIKGAEENLALQGRIAELKLQELRLNQQAERSQQAATQTESIFGAQLEAAKAADKIGRSFRADFAPVAVGQIRQQLDGLRASAPTDIADKALSEAQKQTTLLEQLLAKSGKPAVVNTTNTYNTPVLDRNALRGLKQ